MSDPTSIRGPENVRVSILNHIEAFTKTPYAFEVCARGEADTYLVFRMLREIRKEIAPDAIAPGERHFDEGSSEKMEEAAVDVAMNQDEDVEMMGCGDGSSENLEKAESVDQREEDDAAYGDLASIEEGPPIKRRRR